MITRRFGLVALASTILVPRALAQVDDELKPLSFKIARVPDSANAHAGALTLMATYGDNESKTQFVLEFQAERKRAIDEKGSAVLGDSIGMSFGRGTLRHVPGSHPAMFFEELGKALAASAPKLSNAKQDALPFDVAFLGRPAARSPGGGLGPGPGDWHTTKLFIGQDEAEVFFNFNLVSGEAEFSIKDEEYGNTIVFELSKVIW